MARIFITGSSDGLGLLAAQQLIKDGNQVVLHARNEARKEDTLSKVPGAESILIGDLSNMSETQKLAADLNDLGVFDTIIHNAGIYHADNVAITKVNTLAPYVLTCLIKKPKRLIYLSSGLHKSGQVKLKELKGDFEGINYSDTKLHVLMLAKAVARLWKNVQSNTVDPGWVPTKMGGAAASDNLQKGYETQVWLATTDEKLPNGQYYFHQKIESHHEDADNQQLQDEFLKVCEQITGVTFPA